MFEYISMFCTLAVFVFGLTIIGILFIITFNAFQNKLLKMLKVQWYIGKYIYYRKSFAKYMDSTDPKLVKKNLLCLKPMPWRCPKCKEKNIRELYFYDNDTLSATCISCGEKVWCDNSPTEVWVKDEKSC